MDELFASHPRIFEKTHLNCTKPIYSLLIYIIIALFLYLFLAYGTYKFIKIFWKVNRNLTMFFIMLNMSYLARIAFFAVIEYYLKKEWKFISGWQYAAMASLWNLCFVSAIIFMITNWLFLISRVNRYENMGDNSKWNLIILFNISMQLVSVFLFAFVTYRNCSISEGPNPRIENTNKILVVTLFVFLSFLFVLVGLKLYLTLKRVSEDKAIMMKKRITISWLLISVPLVIKTIFWIFYIYYDLGEVLIIKPIKYNSYDFSVFFLLYYILLDLAPKAGQYIVIRIVVLHYYSNLDRALQKHSQYINLDYYSSISEQSSNTDSINRANNSAAFPKLSGRNDSSFKESADELTQSLKYLQKK